MRVKLTGCMLWLTLLISASCFAQVVNPEGNPETVSIFTGAQFHYRTLEGEREETVQQLVSPLFITAMVTESLGIRIYQTASTSKLEDGQSLDGLGTTRIRGSYSLLGNRLMPYLGLGLPIDKVTPEAETENLSDLLYNEPLQFGVNRLTEGLDLDGGLVFVQPFGRLAISIGGGYTLRGNYDTLGQGEDLIDYNPGDLASATAGLHYYTGLLSLYGGASYFYYADDTIDNDENDSFENGNELSFTAAAGIRSGPVNFQIYGTETIKGDSDASQEMAEISNLFTNRLSGGASLAYSLFRDTLILKTQTNAKWFTNDGEADAKAISLGGGFDLIISDSVKLDILASLITGNMDAGETDISGFNLSAIIRVGF